MAEHFFHPSHLDAKLSVYSNLKEYQYGVFIGDDEMDKGALEVRQAVEDSLRVNFASRVKALEGYSQNENWPDLEIPLIDILSSQ
jgi:hypothetical protein